MDDYRLPDNEIFALKRFRKTLEVKVISDLLDIDAQTVRQYFKQLGDTIHLPVVCYF